MTNAQSIQPFDTSTDFPLVHLEAIAGQMYPPTPSFGLLHWHTEFQFIYVHAGHINLHSLEKTDKVLAKQGVFINSNLMHQIVPDKDSHYSSFVFPASCIAFPGSALETVVQALQTDEKELIVLEANEPLESRILTNLQEIYTLYTSDFSEKRTELASIQVLLADCLLRIHRRNRKETLSPNKEHLLLERMLRFIADHYGESIQVEHIAASTHISSSHCQRLFKQILNFSPHQYLIRYRLEKAKELLEMTSLPITDIAVETGFSQTSHLSQLFKKEYGQTPKQYQKTVSQKSTKS